MQKTPSILGDIKNFSEKLFVCGTEIKFNLN